MVIICRNNNNLIESNKKNLPINFKNINLPNINSSIIKNKLLINTCNDNQIYNLKLKFLDTDTNIALFDKELCLTTLFNIINKKFNLNRSKYYITNQFGKIILNDKILNTELSIKNLNIIRINLKIKGGIFDLILEVLILTVKLCEKLIKGIKFLLKFSIWSFQLIMRLGIDLWKSLNPISKFGDDIFTILKVLVMSILMVPFNILYYILKKSSDMVLSSIAGSFWGWDQRPQDEWDRINSEYLNSKDECKSRKCFVTKKKTVPFSILLGTIVCPPVGVFMKFGFTGWINIIVCCFLTALYYFPGLIYSLITLYC